jgi:arylsulfatase A-like enzyme
MGLRRNVLAAAAAASILAGSGSAQAPALPKPHNAIMFISDGLRAASVNADSAPTMTSLRRKGVEFSNSHSLYPTVTTANASAIATGHYLGDTGDFGNTLYFGFPIWAHGGALTSFLENDAVLGQLNEHYQGNYLNEQSLVATARKAGYATAILGKVGPSFIQDALIASEGGDEILIDDTFGKEGGLQVPAAVLSDLKTARIAATTPATSVPDIEQEFYLANVAAKVVLPRLARSGRPFLLVFWSRDPDISQHNARDSVGSLTPGVDGPSGRAAIRNADETLATLVNSIHEMGLDGTTDFFLTADHGFATIEKTSTTSWAAQHANPKGDLPAGFLAVDVANGLEHSPLFDPDGAMRHIDYANGETSSGGNGLIGTNPRKPEVIVTANGGSDFIYIQPGAEARAPQIVKILLAEDYVSGIFVNDVFGSIPGTLPMSRINLIGSALTPTPSIVVSFRSFATQCDDPLYCTAAIADTNLQRGQGNHGGFSRAETFNFMAAFGPDFKSGFNDTAPVSNADIAPTLARVLGLTLPAKGKLIGRVIAESLRGADPVKFEKETIVSPPAENGMSTILNLERIGTNVYFDAAGFQERTVGLEAPSNKSAP